MEKIIQRSDANTFREKYYAQYKEKTPPFWNRIQTQGKHADGFKEFSSVKIENSNQVGLKIQKVSSELEHSAMDFDENRYGIDSFYPEEVYAFHNEGFYIKIEKNAIISEPIYIEYTLSKENDCLLDLNIIEIGENASANIIIHYRTEDESEVYKNSVLKVIAKEYSSLKLSRIQNLNLNSHNYDFSDFNLQDHADIKYYNAEFGAKINVGSSTSYLNGFNANMETTPAYLADKERKVDLAYSVIFRGKKTNGQINGCGAVMDRAIKVFRGNIYFERGSTGSVGREGSFDILLDKTVESHSIPTLFCDEDNVIGEHYASVGKIDETKLMYLMSRGIPEQAARKVIVESSFRPLFDNIDHEDTKKQLIAELNRRIS